MKKMTLIDKALFLKKTPLFGALDLNLLLPISDKVGVMEFESKELIFNLEDEGNRIYFIVKGSVEILNKDKHLLATLESPDFFGDESIFSETPRKYSARTLTETQTLILSRTHLLTIISESPNVCIDLLKVYSSSLDFRSR